MNGLCDVQGCNRATYMGWRPLTERRGKQVCKRHWRRHNDHGDSFESMYELAVLYKEQGRYEEAEKNLLEALEGRRLKLGDTHPHTLKSIKNLVTLYEAWNKPEKAKEWRTKLSQTEAKTE